MARGFVYITDYSTPTGSRLFNGSAIKCWVQRNTISGKNNLDIPFKANQDPELISSDNGKLGSAWNRRKCNIQDTGAENLQITMSGGWDNNVGSANGATDPKEYNLSPYKIKRMGDSGHSFYVKGGTALQSFIDGEQQDISPGGTHTGSYYTGSGIPVHIVDWHIEDRSDEIDYVSWNMVLIEDKDTANMTN